ncbi:DUF1090 family protein, partial [Salmonella enterica subsp. enterica serovar Virginia]|nr:DUF1090 family protein [Salmonella enterica subsp. enterica serovar Virginia]
MLQRIAKIVRFICPYRGNNQRRIEGLNKALSEVRANCTDSKLRAEHQKKIAEQKEEVAE